MAKSPAFAIHKYEYTPVLLHLPHVGQTKTIGYNLVEEIPRLLYGHLKSGSITMWFSGAKKVKIGLEEFHKMELGASKPFTDATDLFINEYWQVHRKNFTFYVAGFTFVGKHKNGETFNYGFVDAEDIFELLKKNKVMSNANGSSNVTYWDALMMHAYDFNLVQFGKNDFKKNPILSFELKNQAMYDPTIRRKTPNPEVQKSVEFRVVQPSITSNTENALMFDKIEEALLKNKHVVMNALGITHLEALLDKDFKVDHIEFEEVWVKKGDLPFQELVSLTLGIDGKIIKLNSTQITELEVLIKFQRLEDYIAGKNFDFLLQKINAQEIKPIQSDKYYKALLTNNWKNID